MKYSPGKRVEPDSLRRSFAPRARGVKFRKFMPAQASGIVVYKDQKNSFAAYLAEGRVAPVSTGVVTAGMGR